MQKTKHFLIKLITGTFLFFLLSLCIFTTSYGWQDTTDCENTLIEETGYGGYENLRTWTTNYWGGLVASSTEEWAVSEITMQFFKFVSPTFVVYAYVLDSTGIIITSNESYDSSTFGTCNANFEDKTFTFDAETLAIDTNYYVMVGGDTTYDSNNYIKIKYHYVDTYDESFGILNSTYGLNTYINGGFTGTVKTYCMEETATSTTNIDMASTTIAIQNIADNLQYFFMFLIWFMVVVVIVIFYKSL